MEGRRDRSRRGLLQRIAGELGTVLPRVPHGTLRRPAQGWYIRLELGERAGEEVFLGDYSGLAEHKLHELLCELMHVHRNGSHA